jgi:hypothetical protein
MVLQLPLLAAIPSGVLDMTADFAPLLVGLWVVMGLCVLGLTLTIAIHDTREANRTAKQVTKPEPSFPKAA